MKLLATLATLRMLEGVTIFFSFLRKPNRGERASIFPVRLREILDMIVDCTLYANIHTLADDQHRL